MASHIYTNSFARVRSYLRTPQYYETILCVFNDQSFFVLIYEKQKKKKDKDKKPAKLPKIKAPLKNTEIKKPKSKLGNSKPEVTASTNNGDSKNNKVMVKKIKQPLKSKPSKLKNTDTGRKQTGANPK